MRTKLQNSIEEGSAIVFKYTFVKIALHDDRALKNNAKFSSTISFYLQ